MLLRLTDKFSNIDAFISTIKASYFWLYSTLIVSLHLDKLYLPIWLQLFIYLIYYITSLVFKIILCEIFSWCITFYAFLSIWYLCHLWSYKHFCLSLAWLSISINIRIGIRVWIRIRTIIRMFASACAINILVILYKYSSLSAHSVKIFNFLS